MSLKPQTIEPIPEETARVVIIFFVSFVTWCLDFR
jgi:hypothetical protein